MKTVHGLALAAALGLFAAPAARAEGLGPHKGPVAEWGDEEYHLEVVASDGAVTVYVYGSHDDLHAGKAKPLAAKSLTLSLATTPPAVVKLEPAPAKEDPAGSATVFVGKHAAVKAGAKLAGAVSGRVGAKPYTGDFGK